MNTAGLLEGFGTMYSVITKANHEIKWWAIILCGLIIRGAYVFLASPYPATLSLPLQKAVANLVNFTIYFCIMLIVIQFHPYYMPFIEWSIEYIIEFIDELS